MVSLLGAGQEGVYIVEVRINFTLLFRIPNLFHPAGRRVIYYDDGVAALCKLFDQVRADKSCPAGNDGSLPAHNSVLSRKIR